VKDIDFLSGFCSWKFKKIYKKNWVWKEKSVEPNNVFPLGPTAQAILVIMNRRS